MTDKYVRERLWHPSQTFEEHEDGSLIVTLRVAATFEVRRWVLGFGAEVLEPASLRREIVAEARKIAEPETERAPARDRMAYGTRCMHPRGPEAPRERP
jgi:hypothetical protein